MSLHDDMLKMGDAAVSAARALARLTSEQKNAILEAMARELDAGRDGIKAANATDMEAGAAAGLSAAMLDRLRLDDKRIDGMIAGIRTVVDLDDPVGERLSTLTRPNGLEIRKVRVPIGVVAIIYESRPNVTADSAVLCLKTGNAVILRTGKEALRSSTAIADTMMAGGRKAGLPEHALQIVGTIDRDAIRELVQMEGRVDVAIPRGGEGLIRAVTEQARIPVIKHYKGVCHAFVDASADIDMALAIVEDAKCQRPGVCNAIEKVLVHERIAAEFLPKMAAVLSARGVQLRGDARAVSLVPTMAAATDADWHEEYLDLILTVKVVADVDAAVAHINHFGSHHSDCIVTRDAAAAQVFEQDVDSSTVYVNASTRFTDGGEFGMGAEIGISTDKLHARGPMGLVELTTYKYVIHGTGQIRG
jgi:glutamate-5-semialdehyde dehydrogenase